MIKVDATSAAIVKALRDAGAFVELIQSATGRAGVPDLLVGIRGETFLIEVKILKGKRDPRPAPLSVAQAMWHADWSGHPVSVVATAEQALRAVGLL